MEPLKDEITNVLIYKKDNPRLALIKYELNDPAITSKQDVIHHLINEHYELERIKQQLTQNK
jgi:hypothetical protein